MVKNLPVMQEAQEVHKSIMPLKKKKSTYFNLKTFYFEKNAKHSLSLQPVAVFWLLGVLLLTDQSGSWLRWGWPWQFPKVKQQ